jgi:protocatechuate 3,4-dioxygenase beta subunit
MLRFLPAATVIGLSLSLFAQTQPVSPKKAEQSPVSPALVTGRVVTETEGSPLKSARVALISEGPRQDRQIYSATSDSDGRFVLKDVAPGRYRFFASHVGFVDQSFQATAGEPGALLALKPEQKMDDVLFRMTLAAVISGRVNNEDGDPMVRTRVVALRKPSEEDEEDSFLREQQLLAVASAQTDDRGQYRIFGLAPGEYYIQASDSLVPDFGTAVSQSFWVLRDLGTEYAPVYYPGVAQEDQAQLLSLKPGSEVQADFSMQRVKTAELAGHVIGPEGFAKGVVVSLENTGHNDFGFNRSDTTDENGSFRFKNVTPGSYVILAYQRRDGMMNAQGRQKIEVGGENIDSITLTLGGGATFQGRITLAGPGPPALDQIGVALIPAEDGEGFGGHGQVKKDGSFEITSVSDGSYAINVWGLERDWYIKSARSGAEDLLEKGLQVEHRKGGRLEIVLSPASAQLEGSVTQNDKPVIGAPVGLVPDPKTPYNRFRSRSIRTDQMGRFVITGVPPGKYRVVARSPSVPGGRPRKSDPQSVTVSEREHASVEIKIPKPETE